MNPWIHSVNSARRYKGQPSDYLLIHQTMDCAKEHLGTIVHRLILHNTFGISLVEKLFGEIVKAGNPDSPVYVRQNYIVNSDGIKVYVKNILQDHVLEDMAGRIPTLAEQFQDITVQLVASRLGVFGPLLRKIKQEEEDR